MRKILVSILLVFALPATGGDYTEQYARLSQSIVSIATQEFSYGPRGVTVQPGLGSGIILSPELILTSAHVVDTADRINVKYIDGDRRQAGLVSLDANSDVALLRLKKPREDVVAAVIGMADEALVGSEILVIGSPYGFEQSLSVGILSGRTTKNATTFLQTDAAINPGNSGGAMFNATGEVIGVVSYLISESGSNNGMGFASSINEAHKKLMESTGMTAGFDGIELNISQSKALNVPDHSVSIQRVLEGTKAGGLGLKAGTLTAKLGSQSLLLGGDTVTAVVCAICEGVKGLGNKIRTALESDFPYTISVIRDRETVHLNGGSEIYYLHSSYY